jgi:hypothetical protein
VKENMKKFLSPSPWGRDLGRGKKERMRDNTVEK